MSKTAQSPGAAFNEFRLRRYELTVSPYERVASMLLALLAVTGVTVLTMLILWLTSQIFAGDEAVPVPMVEIGTGDGGLSGGMELDAPLAEELGQETDLEEPSLENTLAAVADAVANRQALLDDPALTDQVLPGEGGSTGTGQGLGFGPGPGGTGRGRHWEVRFPEGNTVESYARQLDSFGIQLGVLMPNNQVVYVYNLTKPRPDTRTGTASDEKRYYLTWQTGGLEEADRTLLARADVSAEGGAIRKIFKFLPPDLEGQLAGMEQKRAGNEADSVRATYFGIQPSGRGYKFYVIDQTYK